MSHSEQPNSGSTPELAARADRYRPIEPELLTPQEYAHLRRSSVRTLDRERADGRGCPFVRLGSRVFYRRRDIDRYIEAQVRGGEFRAVDAPAGPRSRRRGQRPSTSTKAAT